MQLTELFLIAVGLAMDAFAVSIAKGLTMKKVNVRDALLVGAWFGTFQFLMPLIGAFLGTRFLRQIEAVDHWVALAILGAVGGNMIRETFSKSTEKEEDKTEKTDLSFSTMLMLAVATSIDALAVGITFGLLPVRIVPASALVGIVTLGISFCGVYAGRLLGSRAQKGASLLGGAVLIGIGLKILLEHLGVIA